jgi:hypothetical protein
MNEDPQFPTIPPVDPAPSGFGMQPVGGQPQPTQPTQPIPTVPIKQPRINSGFNPFMIGSVVLGILVVGLGIFLAITLMDKSKITTELDDYKNNFDQKVSTKVADAVAAQKKTDDEAAKSPYNKFTSPADFGSVSFNYPRTWSIYEYSNTGSYSAYFNITPVPPVENGSGSSFYLNISDSSYDSRVSGMDSLVKKGDVTSSTVTASGVDGKRYDGKFTGTGSNNGAVVLFKIRDKVLSITVYNPDYVTDLNNIILPSLTFKP